MQMKKVFIPTYKVSKEKAESLGVEFVPLEVSIKETSHVFIYLFMVIFPLIQIWSVLNIIFELFTSFGNDGIKLFF